MDRSYVLVIIGAYLVGAIPFSQLIAQWRTGLSLREVGEGNVGSRNVWHVVGPTWGILAGLLDVLKGYMVCWAASMLAPLVVVLLAGIAVLLGHQFPIFLRGRGGKGLATALGVIVAIAPLVALCGLAILGLTNLIFRDFNRAVAIAIIGIILLPIPFQQPLWVPVYVLVLALMAALKKRLDRAHETLVWQTHPWQGTATPGWQPPTGDDASSSDIAPR